MLEQKERGRAGATAPPQGLVLLGIVYDGQADTERGQIQKDTDSAGCGKMRTADRYRKIQA